MLASTLQGAAEEARRHGRAHARSTTIPADADVVLCHQGLADRARATAPDSRSCRSRCSWATRPSPRWSRSDQGRRRRQWLTCVGTAERRSASTHRGRRPRKPSASAVASLVDARRRRARVRRRDARARAVRLHLHGRGRRHPARHRREQGRRAARRAVVRAVPRRRRLGRQRRATIAIGIAAAGDDHVGILSQLAKILVDPDQAKQLREAADADTVLALLQPHEGDDELMKVARFYAPGDSALEDAAEPTPGPGRGEDPGPQLLHVRHRRQDLRRRPPAHRPAARHRPRDRRRGRRGRLGRSTDWHRGDRVQVIAAVPCGDVRRVHARPDDGLPEPGRRWATTSRAASPST